MNIEISIDESEFQRQLTARVRQVVSDMGREELATLMSGAVDRAVPRALNDEKIEKVLKELIVEKVRAFDIHSYIQREVGRLVGAGIRQVVSRM